MRPANPTLPALLLLPSTYGLAVWSFSALLSQLGIVPAFPITLRGWVVLLFVALLFVASITVHLPSARRAAATSVKPDFIGWDYVLFAVSTVIGGYGLYAYISEASVGLGSVAYFFDDLFSATLSLRKVSHEVESVGFQLSYFSWISIFLGAYLIVRTPANIALKLAIGGIIVAEFLLNLSFVARTRPIWILLTTGLAIYFATNVLKVRLRALVAGIFIAPVGMFLAFALFTGKFDASRGAVSSLVEYLISGPLYLDTLLNLRSWPDFVPVRTFYPLSKSMEILGLLRDVPDAILPFHYVPFKTNVGTFLEPLYMDGGYPYLIFGAIVLVFGTDMLALYAFKSGIVFGRYLWANLIFAQLLCFFAPRYNTPAIYLFLAIFFAMNALATRPVKAKSKHRRSSLRRLPRTRHA